MLGDKLSCRILMPIRSKKYSSVSLGLKSSNISWIWKERSPVLPVLLGKKKKEHAEKKKRCKVTDGIIAYWVDCGCWMKFHSGMLPFRKQCNKKEYVPFPFHPNQSRRAVLSIALIFVFNSSFYFSSWLYYHTSKTLGELTWSSQNKHTSLLYWAPLHCFLFAQHRHTASKLSCRLPLHRLNTKPCRNCQHCLGAGP